MATTKLHKSDIPRGQFIATQWYINVLINTAVGSYHVQITGKFSFIM